MTAEALREPSDAGPPAGGVDRARTVNPALLARAKQAYQLTARRKQLLGDKLFFDPAWNMLLDLFVSECAGRRLSVSALCIGSLSSSATALRYAAMLIDAGLIERTADSSDGRRSYVFLTGSGWDAMQQLLSA